MLAAASALEFSKGFRFALKFSRVLDQGDKSRKEGEARKASDSDAVAEAARSLGLLIDVGLLFGVHAL